MGLSLCYATLAARLGQVRVEIVQNLLHKVVVVVAVMVAL